MKIVDVVQNKNKITEEKEVEKRILFDDVGKRSRLTQLTGFMAFCILCNTFYEGRLENCR